ncbi:hypothetical protein BRD00_04040 [Halobacteriales archaeon QS_8_69_26]|nr:MAG: hypothetical protein BRD00_04040 [Halobacteriales archaeon QS_8_69_26]
MFRLDLVRDCSDAVQCLPEFRQLLRVDCTVAQVFGGQVALVGDFQNSLVQPVLEACQFL